MESKLGSALEGDLLWDGGTAECQNWKVSE